MSNFITSNTVSLAQAASDLGPFLFAIILTPLTTYALRAYVKEQNPDRSNTLRIYFLGSFLFTICVVLISVTWWIYDRDSSKSYVYTVRIDDVEKENYTLLNNNASYNDVTYNGLLPQKIFVFVRRRPLPKGTAVEIDMYPASGSLSGSNDVAPFTPLLATINDFDNEFRYSGDGLTPISNLGASQQKSPGNSK
jgi:hypothetical protein